LHIFASTELSNRIVALENYRCNFLTIFLKLFFKFIRTHRKYFPTQNMEDDIRKARRLAAQRSAEFLRKERKKPGSHRRFRNRTVRHSSHRNNTRETTPSSIKNMIDGDASYICSRSNLVDTRNADFRIKIKNNHYHEGKLVNDNRDRTIPTTEHGMNSTCRCRQTIFCRSTMTNPLHLIMSLHGKER
jgi:hypothetical protein